MPLQNRVTPFGDIVAAPERGMFLGNRGIIHDPTTRTLLKRRWTTKAWIICVCDFRSRRRTPMAQRSWTELFFLDEATAFAAGHRPCFYCRRTEAEAFKAAFNAKSAPEMDDVLYAERLNGRGKRFHPIEGDWRRLPDGTMVAVGEQAFVIRRGQALAWTGAGYGPPSDLRREVRLITPPSTLAAFAAGYRPVLHPTAALTCPRSG